MLLERRRAHSPVFLLSFPLNLSLCMRLISILWRSVETVRSLTIHTHPCSFQLLGFHFSDLQRQKQCLLRNYPEGLGNPLTDLFLISNMYSTYMQTSTLTFLFCSDFYLFHQSKHANSGSKTKKNVTVISPCACFFLEERRLKMTRSLHREIEKKYLGSTTSQTESLALWQSLCSQRTRISSHLDLVRRKTK